MVDYLDPLVFSEATKTSHKAFEKDATGIIWAVKNREARPDRFGVTREEVIFADKQFTGVGGDEWNKVINNKLTKEEEWYFKRGVQLRKAIDGGKIADPTGGADHYYNPKLASPDWAEVMVKHIHLVHTIIIKKYQEQIKKVLVLSKPFTQQELTVGKLLLGMVKNILLN